MPRAKVTPKPVSTPKEKRENWNNDHRSGKVTFTAYLRPEEAELIRKTKELLEIKTDRSLLLKLCKDISDINQ